MNPALTVKSQVTVPKEIRDFLGIGPGERLKFEPMADGRVAIAPVVPRTEKSADPFDRLKGSGKRGVSTDKVMRATRGDDWNR
ncbi:MAG: AbrB/MazE/SpoVT family DNA-binding domain-containing protein [Rhodoferax sp.]|nr:AbrB/MazE/SpoVT family DNA-binding domain-containing protein [Rhodoferax sp.]